MHRRNFITTASVGVPVLITGIAACKSTDNQSAKLSAEDSSVEKAIRAMLCMQRMAWEQGTASQALIAAGKNDLAILFARDAVVRQTPDGRLGIVSSDPGVTDPASNGEAVLLAWKETGEEKFKVAADAMYRYLKIDAPKTADGVLHHVTYAKQVWSDASFMAPPFLALMGDYDESVRQIEGFRKYLMDPEKKLYYHIWDETENKYARKLFWGGGNGWTAAAIAKIINVLPADRGDLKSKLIGYGREVIEGCLAYMRDDGLFHDIIDDPASFVETNLGQMLSFAIYTGVRAGWLDGTFKNKADILRKAAQTKVDEYGIVRDAAGSPSFDKPGTSTEAQSFYIMMEFAHQSLQSTEFKTGVS